MIIRNLKNVLFQKDFFHSKVSLISRWWFLMFEDFSFRCFSLSTVIEGSRVIAIHLSTTAEILLSAIVKIRLSLTFLQMIHLLLINILFNVWNLDGIKITTVSTILSHCCSFFRKANKIRHCVAGSCQIKNFL